MKILDLNKKILTKGLPQNVKPDEVGTKNYQVNVDRKQPPSLPVNASDLGTVKLLNWKRNSK